MLKEVVLPLLDFCELFNKMNNYQLIIKLCENNSLKTNFKFNKFKIC